MTQNIFETSYNVTKKNVSDKLHGSGQYSFQARLIDLGQPFYMVSQNPITGVGLDDENYNIEIINFIVSLILT